MANPDVTAGRPTGDSQSHDHLKRARTYSIKSGGTVQGGIDTAEAPAGKGANGYSDSACEGGMTVNGPKS